MSGWIIRTQILDPGSNIELLFVVNITIHPESVYPTGMMAAATAEEVRGVIVTVSGIRG